MNGWVGRFQTKGEHGPVRQGFHQRLGDRLGGFEVLSDDGRVAVIGVKDAEALVFSQAVKQLCNRFGIWHRIFQFTHAFGHVSVGVGHAAEADMVHASVVGDAHLLDDVLRRSPNRDAFLRFDAEFASSFVAHTALVDFDLVRQRSGFRFAAEVGMVAHGFACSTRLCPCRPLLGRPALMFPLTLFEEVVQRGVRVLNSEEEVGPKRRPALLFPSTNRPATKQCGCAVGQASDEGLGFFERNGGAPQVFPGDDRTSNADHAEAILQAPCNGFRVGLEGLPIAVNGQVFVIQAS